MSVSKPLPITLKKRENATSHSRRARSVSSRGPESIEERSLHAQQLKEKKRKEILEQIENEQKLKEKRVRTPIRPKKNHVQKEKSLWDEDGRLILENLNLNDGANDKRKNVSLMNERSRQIINQKNLKNAESITVRRKKNPIRRSQSVILSRSIQKNNWDDFLLRQNNSRAHRDKFINEGKALNNEPNSPISPLISKGSEKIINNLSTPRRSVSHISKSRETKYIESNENSPNSETKPKSRHNGNSVLPNDHGNARRIIRDMELEKIRMESEMNDSHICTFTPDKSPTKKRKAITPQKEQKIREKNKQRYEATVNEYKEMKAKEERVYQFKSPNKLPGNIKILSHLFPKRDKQ